MQKYIKPISLILIVTGLVFAFSCDNKDEIETRTFEEEQAELDSILHKKIEDGYDIDTTDLGVYYIVREEGEGPLPGRGDTCFIDYRAFYTDGTLFDASDSHHTQGIWKFLYGEPDMIPGLKNGIGRMNEGAIHEMMILSNLAYGERGTSTIPPYTTLVYIVEMHELNPVEK
jgi:FKBP-type peptidyl-prolyl cis-trans isomerase FkpA